MLFRSALSNLLDENNNLVKSFRMTRDRYKSHPNSEFYLQLISNGNRDGQQYNLPIVFEVAGLIIDDFNVENFQRDIIVEHRIKGLKKITDLHPSFMSMTYPLIHPYGEDGYRLGILLRKNSNSLFKR